MSNLLRRGGRYHADYYTRLAARGRTYDDVLKDISHLDPRQPDARAKRDAICAMWDDPNARSAAIADLPGVYDAVAVALEASDRDFAQMRLSVDARIAANPLANALLADVSTLRDVQQRDADRWKAFMQKLNPPATPTGRAR
jgi:hypothetical protein